MAAALAHHRLGYDVGLYERYSEIKAAGNIVNLWPPPQKVLEVLGVDTTGLGAPCHSTSRRWDGHLRADVRLTREVEERYGGGFIGLLRWGVRGNRGAPASRGRGGPMTRARDLKPGDIVEVPAGDADRLGVPYAEIVQGPRAHAGYATPFLGLVGLVAVEIRAVGGNGTQVSCTWPGRTRLTLIRSDPAGPGTTRPSR